MPQPEKKEKKPDVFNFQEKVYISYTVEEMVL